MEHELDRSGLTELQLVFLEQIEGWLPTLKATHCRIERRASGKHDSFDVKIKPGRPNSLAIIASAEPKEIIVFFSDRWHHHFDPSIFKESPHEISKQAIDFLDAAPFGRFKLVLKKKKRSGEPYKACSYIFKDGSWKSFRSTEIYKFWYSLLPFKTEVQTEELMNAPQTGE
jgi:hypothetical protein